MDLLTVGLSFIHVSSAVIWVGSAGYVVQVLEPGLRRLAPEVRGPAMQALGPRHARIMMMSAILVFITGVLLVLRKLGLSGLDKLFTADWGRSIFLGSLFALAMFLVGLLIIGRSAARLEALAAKGTPPAPEEAMRLQQRMRLAAIIAFALGVLALLEMVIAAGF